MQDYLKIQVINYGLCLQLNSKLNKKSFDNSLHDWHITRSSSLNDFFMKLFYFCNKQRNFYFQNTNYMTGTLNSFQIGQKGCFCNKRTRFSHYNSRLVYKMSLQTQNF